MTGFSWAQQPIPELKRCTVDGVDVRKRAFNTQGELEKASFVLRSETGSFVDCVCLGVPEQGEAIRGGHRAKMELMCSCYRCRAIRSQNELWAGAGSRRAS